MWNPLAALSPSNVLGAYARRPRPPAAQPSQPPLTNPGGLVGPAPVGVLAGVPGFPKPELGIADPYFASLFPQGMTAPGMPPSWSPEAMTEFAPEAGQVGMPQMPSLQSFQAMMPRRRPPTEMF